MIIKKLEDIYKQIAKNDSEYGNCCKVLQQQEWLLYLFDYDPSTGEALSTNLEDVLYRISKYEFLNQNKANDKTWYSDRLQRIIDYSSSSITKIFEMIHEKQIREHYITRPERIRQYDSESIRYLSKKPGRTIKQKISINNHKAMGVFHNTSVDTLENRLLKVFIKKLDDILYEKEKAFGFSSMSEYQKYFNSLIHRWLKSDEAENIGKWSNLPPNNTLLNDKNYRKIWNSWLELINLDEYCKKDFENLVNTQELINCWKNAAEINLHNGFSFMQQPLLPTVEEKTGYLKIELKPFLNNLSLKITNKSGVTLNSIDYKITDINNNVLQELSNRYPDNIKVDFELRFKEKLNNDYEEVSVVDLLEVRPYYANISGKIGRLQARMRYQYWEKKDKKNTFYDIPLFYSPFYDNKKGIIVSIKDLYEEKHDNIILLQKSANFFAKEIAANLHTKKCIYLLPDDADDFSLSQKALRNSLNIAFQKTDALPRSIAAIFNHQKKLLEQEKSILPNSIYYIFDNFKNYTVKTKIEIKYDKKLEERNPETKGLIFERYPCEIIKAKNREVSEENSFSLNIKENFCEGALFLDKLQNITPDLPLWKDHLPPLYMKIDVNGKFKPFYLVGEKTPPVQPKRGIACPIEITEKFKFPIGVSFYEFPLVQGQKADTQKYFAYIKNNAFPLKKEVDCKLRLTYTYGAEIPYELQFISLDAEIPFRAKVRWETETHINPYDLPAPGFIPETTWKDMYYFKRRTPSRRGETHSNIIEDWLPQQFYEIQKAYTDGCYDVCKFTKGLRFPSLSFWKFDRSIYDEECPEDFKKSTENSLQNAVHILKNSTNNELKNEMLYFLGCASSDIEIDISEYFNLDSIAENETLRKAYAYALGNLSREWQFKLLNQLLEKIGKNNFEDMDALYILSIAIWRSKGFVNKLTAGQIEKILNASYNILSTRGIKLYMRENRNTRFIINEPVVLEVILGILRGRRCPDGKLVEDEEILKVLCPSDNLLLAEMVKSIEKCENLRSRYNSQFNTRIELELGDNHKGNVPDLVQAVKLYLAPTKKAYSIKIANVIENE